MKRVLIAGIGNVLLGDDGVGPFVVTLLDSHYHFDADVELADLGTPGFDLPVHLSGADAVILVDSAKLGRQPGDIRTFRRAEILRIPARARIDPHAPTLRESLSFLELMGAMPRDFTLIGMQGKRFEPGSSLSRPVRDCIPHLINAVLRELHRLQVSYETKTNVPAPGIWWDGTGKAA